MEVKINFDGACNNEGHPPLMGIGVAVWIDGVRRPEYERAFCGGVGTNNIAEYQAVVAGLKVAEKIQKDYMHATLRVIILGDSLLIVNQLNKVWECKASHLKPYYRTALSIKGNLVNTQIGWVKRDKNAEADILSKKGLLIEAE